MGEHKLKKAVVLARGGSPANTGETKQQTGNSLVNPSGIRKPGMLVGTASPEQRLLEGLLRGNAAHGLRIVHRESGRMFRRATERKAAKGARKGGAK